jgi:hypothetical protein
MLPDGRLVGQAFPLGINRKNEKVRSTLQKTERIEENQSNENYANFRESKKP